MNFLVGLSHRLKQKNLHPSQIKNSKQAKVFIKYQWLNPF